jgi:hypothetical protein
MVAWFGLVLQFGLAPDLVRFLSFFTVSTNLIVAVAMTAVALGPATRVGRWFAQPSVAGGVVTAIAFVCLGYEILLRYIWDPQGWQRVADTTLHDATPVLAIAFWFAFVPKRRLRWPDAAWWLLYPALYAAYAMVRGAIAGEYPYHFLDPATAGATGSTAAVAMLTAAFVVLAAIFFGIDRAMRRALANDAEAETPAG